MRLSQTILVLALLRLLSAIEYELEADLQNAVDKLNGQDLKGNAVTLRADPVNRP